MGLLDGKVALVTGGASGMGEGIARAFADEGAAVGIVDRNEAGAKSVAGEIAAGGGKALGTGGDVGDEASVGAAFGAVAEGLGDIDILVNNAGIDTTSPFADMPLDMWDEMMRVNLRSMFLCTKLVIPAMKRKKWGRIINFSSQLAHKGAPTMTHYCASKGGVLAFTRALSYELIQDGITVNAICPGPIDTPLLRSIPQDWLDVKFEELPIKRPGRVDEVVPTIVMLASEAGSYYVGASMNMNGGDVMI